MVNGRKIDIKRELKELLQIIIISVALFYMITTYVRLSIVDGESMNPTLENNDILVVAMKVKEIERGDIVIIEKEDGLIIKRVVGVEGDTIENIAGGEVLLNGEIGEHEYGIIENNQFVTDKVTVGKNEIYVLGDNRANSLDSRYLGSIPIEKVVGKMVVKVMNYKGGK